VRSPSGRWYAAGPTSRSRPSDDALAQAFTDARGDGYDVVVDYLWGRPTEILLRTLIPESFAFPKPARLIQVGEAAGRGLTVTAESLRTSGVEIYGAAKGLNAETSGPICEASGSSHCCDH